MASKKAGGFRVRRSEAAGRSSSAWTSNFLQRLPSEILMRILSYLDASALYSISFVDKLFYQLANDNAIWYKIYIAELNKKKKLKPKSVDEADVQDRATGYWKWQYFEYLAVRDMNKWKRHLGLISRHTGLPSQTERVLRNLNITWELTISEKSGHEATFGLNWFQFFETSVILWWSGARWSDYTHFSTLQLHGVRRTALNSPGFKNVSPGWKSFMEKIDIGALSKSMQDFGQDQLVELKLLKPGIILGVWKDQRCLAFLMLTLHFHRIVEKSIQGSSVSPYLEPMLKMPFDDIDPDFGLHGYQLHIVLHTTGKEIMSRSFSQLFCRRSEICNGLISLTAVNGTNLSQHIPLSGKITFPWICEALQGTVENCCIMSLTLLDEFKNLFWCVCSPVTMKPIKTQTSFDYDGDHFLIHYLDSDGQVKMDIVWMQEQMQFILISLVVYVTTCKVNKHFNRDY